MEGYIRYISCLMLTRGAACSLSHVTTELPPPTQPHTAENGRTIAGTEQAEHAFKAYKANQQKPHLFPDVNTILQDEGAIHFLGVTRARTNSLPDVAGTPGRTNSTPIVRANSLSDVTMTSTSHTLFINGVGSATESDTDLPLRMGGGHGSEDGDSATESAESPRQLLDSPEASRLTVARWRAPLALPDEAVAGIPASGSPSAALARPHQAAAPCIPEEDENDDTESGRYSDVLGEDQVYVAVANDGWDGYDGSLLSSNDLSGPDATPAPRPHRPPAEVVMIREASYPVLPNGGPAASALATSTSPELSDNSQPDPKPPTICVRCFSGDATDKQWMHGLRELMSAFLMFIVLMVLLGIHAFMK